MSVAPAVKRSTESIKYYAMNFGHHPLIRDSGETLSSPAVAQLSVSPTTAGNITIANVSVAGNKVLAQISGGDHAADYLMRWTVATSGGSTLVEFSTIKVRDDDVS